MVVKTLDIVFAQVITGLDFHDLQRLCRSVAQPMHGLLGDVDRLVHMQVHLFVPHAHQTFPGDDDPVLGPVPVTLQTCL